MIKKCVLIYPSSGSIVVNKTFQKTFQAVGGLRGVLVVLAVPRGSGSTCCAAVTATDT